MNCAGVKASSYDTRFSVSVCVCGERGGRLREGVGTREEEGKRQSNSSGAH